MTPSFADKVVDFNRNLHCNITLPDGFDSLNPFLSNPETMKVMRAFYQKYYADNRPRHFIIGINPSRHGAGVTGVPFTDTKRLKSVCDIEMLTAHTHEISSLFLYDAIEAFGGADLFYKNFYINSPFPLAIVKHVGQGKMVNANYYDDPKLFEALKPFMISSMEKHISLGLKTEKVIILGKKNADYLRKLNKEAKLFEEAIVLEHPRYIQQYKSKDRMGYIDKYIQTFMEVAGLG